MTSIEWLIEEMLSKGFFKESVTLTNIDHLQYKAEELHKQEMAQLPQQEISDESWEGCDGCTEQDEIMYKNGYVKGYNAASSQTTSDKWNEYQDWLNEHPEDNLVEITYTEKDIRLAYMQGFNRGVDGNPNHMEEYITHLKSTKTPDVEISDEEIEKEIKSRYETPHYNSGFMDCAQWYREQLRKNL